MFLTFSVRVREDLEGGPESSLSLSAYSEWVLDWIGARNREERVERDEIKRGFGTTKRKNDGGGK